jgi:hypothetical protein
LSGHKFYHNHAIHTEEENSAYISNKICISYDKYGVLSSTSMQFRGSQTIRCEILPPTSGSKKADTDLLIDPEDGGGVFLRNVRLPQTIIFIVTATRMPNLTFNLLKFRDPYLQFYIEMRNYKRICSHLCMHLFSPCGCFAYLFFLYIWCVSSCFFCYGSFII